VVVHGVHETGRRENIGLDVGAAETERSGPTSCATWSPAGWSACSWSSPTPHERLKSAIAKVLGAPWQRCTVHFLRDCLGHARRDQHGLLAARIPPIFNPADPAGGATA
jgi:transposase-like protein